MPERFVSTVPCEGEASPVCHPMHLNGNYCCTVPYPCEWFSIWFLGNSTTKTIFLFPVSTRANSFNPDWIYLCVHEGHFDQRIAGTTNSRDHRRMVWMKKRKSKNRRVYSKNVYTRLATIRYVVCHPPHFECYMLLVYRPSIVVRVSQSFRSKSAPFTISTILNWCSLWHGTR